MQTHTYCTWEWCWWWHTIILNTGVYVTHTHSYYKTPTYIFTSPIHLTSYSIWQPHCCTSKWCAFPGTISAAYPTGIISWRHKDTTVPTLPCQHWNQVIYKLINTILATPGNSISWPYKIWPNWSVPLVSRYITVCTHAKKTLLPAGLCAAIPMHWSIKYHYLEHCAEINLTI